MFWGHKKIYFKKLAKEGLNQYGTMCEKMFLFFQEKNVYQIIKNINHKKPTNKNSGLLASLWYHGVILWDIHLRKTRAI